ncbi:MAG: 1-(5-phosphoribosyl)-5-[(5-phosphoribosylamino)methylideneamino] imidazole-4-carboxamide isomerase [Gemmatimonadota bacterium]
MRTVEEARGPSDTGPSAAFRAVPAVDLRGGRCVQLVGGRPDDERVSLPDPVAVARGWRAKGFPTLHVVDLDAALGDGDQLDLTLALVRDAPGDLQMGGGVRNEERLAALIQAGVNRVVVGTRGVDNPEWLAEMANRYPRRVVAAADIRDGWVLRKGWKEKSQLRVEAYLEALAPLPLAGILCTDVAREGQVKGIHREEVAAVLNAASHPVWISGGVSTMDELHFLRDQGAAGAVLGMALYTGALDGDAVAREFTAAT